MAFDGAAWNEASPDNNDLANQIDDFMRDDKIAVRSRMALEHKWPSSQTGTNQGGFHTFVTFTPQTAAPSLVYGTDTQTGALYIDSTSNNLMFEDSAGSTYTVVNSGVGVTFFGGTGAIGDLPYVTSGGGMVALAAGSSGFVLTAAGTTAAPSWAAAPTSTFGSWQSGTIGSTQTATSDIIVVAYASDNGPLAMVGETPAGTIRLRDGNSSGNANVGVTMPVRSGDTYLISITGAAAVSAASFLPVGS